MVLYDLFVLDYNWKLFDSVMVKRELIKEDWIFPLLSTKLNWQLKKKNNDQRMSSQHFASTLYIAFESVDIILYSVNDVLTAFNR